MTKAQLRSLAPFFLLMLHAGAMASGRTSPATPESADSAVSSLDKMLVRAPRVTSRTEVDIDSVESRIGQVDDLVEVIARQPGVARSSQAGAQYLVHGDGPYDNLVLIRGVRVWQPSHFAWDGFAGRSIFTVATPNDISFLSDGLAGLYGGASGSVLRVDPSIARTPRLKPRPEVTVNGGRIGADVSLMVPLRNGKDLYLLSAKVSDRYAIWNNKVGAYSENHWVPSWFADGQFLGQQSIGAARVEELLWLSLDTYALNLTSGITDWPEEARRPWGIWALTVEDSLDERGWGMTVGGAHQFDIRRTWTSEREVTRTGVSFTARSAPIELGGPRLRLRLDTDWAQWEGTSDEIHLMYERGSRRDSVVRHERNGQETVVGLHVGYESGTDRCRFGLNLRPGFLWPAARAFLDPGFWIRWPADRLSVTFSGGGISSTPDVRGMPSGGYAGKAIRTWRADLDIDAEPVPWLELGAASFVKWKDHVPRIAEAPYIPMWDESQDAALLAYGVALEVGLSVGRRLRLGALQSLGRSWVLDSGKRSRYEWDVPWSTKPYLALAIVPDALYLHAAGIFAAPVPDTEDASGLKSLSWGERDHSGPGFRNLTLKLQLHQNVEGHRYLRQYDAYLQFTDILSLGGGFGELMEYGLLAIGLRMRFRV